ncbi:MAG TPA: two pore domain potassium channel family protein [Dehalococcoidia bacterium]|nr:two pore domain potassium channel family protein [Dehalococcoidia bacterium]
MKNKIMSSYILFLLPILVILIGSIGFMLLEDLSFIDAVYLTIVTISTVGYGDLHPTATASKMFGIVIIIFGIGTFLTIVSNVTQMLIQRGRERLRKQRLNMIIGVFFTEVGNKLLQLFVGFDRNIDNIRDDCSLKGDMEAPEFYVLKNKLAKHEAGITPESINFDALSSYLREKSDLLLRQLENPDLIEHEAFTELLWATVHLRDELMYRDDFDMLPESDLLHLTNDIKRVYGLLTRQWLDYLLHLKVQYPYLFSLALRTNPYVENPTVIVE